MSASVALPVEHTRINLARAVAVLAQRTGLSVQSVVFILALPAHKRPDPVPLITSHDGWRIATALFTARHTNSIVPVPCSNNPEIHADILPNMTLEQAWQCYCNAFHCLEFYE